MVIGRLIFKIHKHAHKCLLRNVKRYSQSAPRDLEYLKLTEADNGIAVMSLNSPRNKNALSVNLVQEISYVLDSVSADTSVRALIIRSLVPKIFCAGADLKERAVMTEKQVSDFVNILRSMTSRIHNLPVPVIAALDGAALGGGMEIALSCDIIISTENTKMGLVETKLAIIPGAGGTQRLPRLINPCVAKELIFTAKIVNGSQAKDLGIVNHAVKANEDGNAAYLKSLELAREIVPNGPIAIRMAKIAINKGIEVDLNTGLKFEEACYAQVIPTKDRTEGLAAFNEKRSPQYKGK